jgi:ferric-dicitrate binding protein FerR (iron transport regulator)
MFKKTVSIDENKLSYQSRIFHFNNTRLADVVKKINEVYPQQIKLSSKQIENCPITVVFNKENFETIVKIIAETHGLKPIRQNYGYLLDGAGCNEK